MMPMVLLMTSHTNPTESVFTMRSKYSLTPGSTDLF